MLVELLKYFTNILMNKLKAKRRAYLLLASILIYTCTQSTRKRKAAASHTIVMSCSRLRDFAFLKSKIFSGKIIWERHKTQRSQVEIQIHKNENCNSKRH